MVYHKTETINRWKKIGLVDDYDKVYEKYMNTHRCEACNASIGITTRKCMDHDHTTGKFRYVLCASCNNHDNWMKYIYPEKTLGPWYDLGNKLRGAGHGPARSRDF